MDLDINHHSHDQSRNGKLHLKKKPTIAIVDDDSSVRLATESLVRSLGFDARTFPSANEFLKSFYVGETACVITDVQMPGMSGVDLQDALLERGHRIPILFITAFPEDRIRDRVLKAGAVCYLIKPFDGRMMSDCLRSALQKQQCGPNER
jgi:FixJ family two-component response regulator